MFYTYTHTRNDTGQVFYVGKGKQRRAWHKKGRGRRWEQIAAIGYTVSIIERFDLEADAFDHEILLIDRLRREGQPLINIAQGGEGASGHVHPADVVEKRRRTILSPVVRKKILDALPRGQDHHASRKVVCVEKNMEFDSLADALRWLRSMGVKASSSTPISRACRGKYLKIYGYTWRYAEDLAPNPFVSRRFLRPIKCIGTGNSFPSIKAAVEWLKRNGHPKACSTALSLAANDGRPRYGFQWE